MDGLTSRQNAVGLLHFIAVKWTCAGSVPTEICLAILHLMWDACARHSIMHIVCVFTPIFGMNHSILSRP